MKSRWHSPYISVYRDPLHTYLLVSVPSILTSRYSDLPYVLVYFLNPLGMGDEWWSLMFHSVSKGPPFDLPALAHCAWYCNGSIQLFVHLSGQIIATSHDLTPNGGLVREIPLFQGNLGWWYIIIWPDLSLLMVFWKHVFSQCIQLGPKKGICAF